MVSSSFNRETLCKYLVGKSRHEVVRILEQEGDAADIKSQSHKGKDRHEKDYVYKKYVGLIGKLLNILNYNGPAILDETEKLLAEPVFQSLRKRGEY